MTLQRAAVAACLSSTLLLAACGGGSGSGGTSASQSSSAPAAASQLEGLPAEQVLAKAKAAVTSAKSVRYVAQGTDDGKSLTVEMRIDKARGAAGSIGLAGEEIKLLRVQDDVYVTGNDALLAAASGGQPVASGKWIKTSAQAPGISSFLELADAGKLMDQIVKPGQKLSLGTAKTVAGQPTVAVVIGPDAKGENGGTMYVAAQGNPYPLLVESAPGAKDQGTVTFSDFDKPVDLAVPAAGDVVAAPGS